MDTTEKKALEQRRRWRVRRRVMGSHDRPRLSLHFSNQHIYVQCIDDEAATTLCHISSLAENLRTRHLRPNLEGARILGTIFGEKALQSGISRVVFDRSSRRYHGAVKAFADSARVAGLNF